MCLSEMKRGQSAQIINISDDEIRTQFIRFGLGIGSQITCLEKIPLGPFMLRYNRQEIAIGREAAKQIQVQAEVA